MFKDVGGLNEQYFLYFEELDFALRAQKQGYVQQCMDELVVKHQGGGSSSCVRDRTMYHETWSTLNFYASHKRFLFPWILVVRTSLRVLTLLMSRRWVLVPTVLRSTWDFLCGKNREWRPVEIIKVYDFCRGETE